MGTARDRLKEWRCAQASIVHKQALPWTLPIQLQMMEPRHRTPECATALTGALLMYGDGSWFKTSGLERASCRQAPHYN